MNREEFEQTVWNMRDDMEAQHGAAYYSEIIMAEFDRLTARIAQLESHDLLSDAKVTDDPWPNEPWAED